MAGICVCRVSAAIIATLHSTLLPLHSLVRYLTAADTYALLVDRKQIGLEVNADKKLSTRSCLEKRMQDELTI